MTRDHVSRAEAKRRHPASHGNLHQIWGVDDFDQCVADALAIVKAGRARRLQLVDEDYLPPAVLFSRSRFRRARVMDALAVALLILLMAALGVIVFAASAKAEPASPAVMDYVDRYGAGAICKVLSMPEHHTLNGMLGVLTAVENDGFSPYESGVIVGESINEFCPQNLRLMQRFVDIYGGTQPA